MQSQFRKSLIASAIALAMFAVAGNASATDSVSQDVIEARQETQIWTTYALSPYLRANDIKVTVHGDTATLTGKVGEDANKDLAKQIALGVNGIKKVDNQIVVTADHEAPKASTDRSFGEFIDDASITTAVKSKLLWSKQAEGMSADVDTRRGKVTLRGTADSAAHKTAAGRLAGNTKGVLSVDNRIEIETAKTTQHKPAPSMSDTWITTKVKSSFMYSANVDGSAISVTTTKGVVDLSGKVNNGVERALAVELAENIRGVTAVNAKGLTTL
ncbi:MAG: BON domain-containing protein [Xanthomonadaceae bacterium]|nr:BON domain-containing protein [Xanthomonadaceae bacterium]MDP2184997.1 BON domain-containing protein [Xanthomonadales bacterium]MDZ4114485.1 BON domain-containing protein [Xanthomonadaceae bacterium]MDZ4378475.1 BON domain-containing protein [Xanthomonadaceae bacterium]